MREKSDTGGTDRDQRHRAIRPFSLERYFAEWEFRAPYLLSPSDTEPWSMAEVMALATEEIQQQWNSLKLGYTESKGRPELRQAVATMLNETSAHQAVHPLSAADVTIFSCAEEAIYVTMRALLRPEDHVVSLWPAYQSLHEVAQAIGAEVTFVPLNEEHAWTIDADAIAKAIRPTTRLVIVNTPHNPTGSHASKHEWDALIAAVEQSHATLFADEVYRLLENEPRHRLPCAAHQSTRAISLGSVSKSLGMAGVRIGWTVTRDDEIRGELEQYKDYTTICASAPAELLAQVAIENWRLITHRQRELVQQNRTVFETFVNRNTNHFSWVMPSAGSTGYCRWQGIGTAETLADLAVERAGIMLLPSTVFGPNPNDPREPPKHFRVGLGRRELPDIIIRFEQFLKDSLLI